MLVMEMAGLLIWRLVALYKATEGTEDGTKRFYIFHTIERDPTVTGTVCDVQSVKSAPLSRSSDDEVQNRPENQGGPDCRGTCGYQTAPAQRSNRSVLRSTTASCSRSPGCGSGGKIRVATGSRTARSLQLHRMLLPQQSMTVCQSFLTEPITIYG